MQRLTTPTHHFVLPIDPATIPVMKLCYEQYDNLILTKDLEDLTVDSENSRVSYTLTQEETGLFDENEIAYVQLRVKLADGTVPKTPLFRLRINHTLDDEEL